MSSLSLPRVLPQRKTSLEQERENFEKFQHVSISKAINTSETAVKEKHVRSAILGTYHEKSGETFWCCCMRLPLQENRIVAWKFCHVLHKVLREGHVQAMHTSYNHLDIVQDLGKLWGHLKEGYGRLIEQYTKLLVYKLKFHRRNPRIPGHLALTNEELDLVGDNDINNYFQLSVEMFDYMDEILTLQELIFASLDMSKSNSMTHCGQCRLAPLIPNILDSSQLYDTCVKILFRLHGSLPPDLLSGHRQRFLKQFQALRKFYRAASVLQYFKNLISIPMLPEDPPNFLVQAELASYVTPVVVVPAPPPEPEEPEDPTPLVDLASPPNGNNSPDIITERDNLIEHLQNELARYRNEVTKVISEHHAAVHQLNGQITDLQTRVALQDSELEQERLLKEDLLKQAQLASKYEENEKKLKVLEEKFQKLKDLYTKLREEHIQLIRQKADVDKQLAQIKSQGLDENEKLRLEELAQELAKLQGEADAASEQNHALECKLEFLTKEKTQVESEVQDLLTQKEDLDVRIQVANQENKKLNEANLKMFDDVVAECERIVKNAVHEIENPALSSATCSLDYLFSLVSPLEESFACMDSEPTPAHLVRLSHRLAQFIIHGKAVSNTSPDIDLGDRMSSELKKLGERCRQTVVLRGKGDGDMEQAKDLLSSVLRLTELLRQALQRGSTDAIGDLVESELANMDRAIEEAQNKMEELLKQSRKADSGIKLEVNEKILDSCTGLMQAIRILVQKSKLLQAEIVAQGRGSASLKEFYKRNHQWTEGLISAAKAVGMGATYLLEAADEVVSGQGKVEYVVVAAQGIAASTAQLVVASRVKADRGSSNLSALQTASGGVNQATATVLANAKHIVELVDQSDDLDLSGLNLHNAKRLEMEAQVRVLELESSLTKERLRLSALRRQHYALAPDSDQLPQPQ